MSSVAYLTRAGNERLRMGRVCDIFLTVRNIVIVGLLLLSTASCGSSSSGTSPEVTTPVVTPTTPSPAPTGTVNGPAADTIAYTGSFGQTSGNYTISGRRVLVHLPPSRSASPALVVAFHGTGSQDDVLSAMQELDALSVSDDNGFILAAPSSTADGGVNADHSDGGPGWVFGGTADSNKDLLIVRAVIQEARRAYNVDASRVYVVGHSNGAFFAYFAAMQLADRVAAFAETSGGLIACGQRTDCEYVARGAASCNAVLASAPASCTCAIGASTFPIQKPGGRVPPGFLKHNSDDDIVSAVYTCRLAQHLGATAQTLIESSGGHAPTNDFMRKAWAFLSTKNITS